MRCSWCRGFFFADDIMVNCDGQWFHARKGMGCSCFCLYRQAKYAPDPCAGCTARMLVCDKPHSLPALPNTTRIC